MPPRLTRLRNPRCLLPIAILLALFIPFSLVLVWTHGVPSSSTILPLIGLGTSSSSEKEEGGWGWDEGPGMGGVQNLESLGYTGAPDALDRFPANVPAPDIVKALKGARWAGGWGVVRVNPGLECGVVKDGVKDDGAAGSGSGQGDEGESGGAEESAGDAAYEMDEDGLPSMREAVTERNAGYDLSNDTIPSLNPYHPTFRRSYRKPRSPLSASISPSNSYFDSLAQKPPHAAFLQLHFFSRPTHTTAPRTRRDLIRRTIFTGVPRRLRRFIDVRFVVAHAWDPALETVLKVEEERYGDLIRVGVPDPGSERGLGVRWVEEVVGAAEKGEGGGREGVWVVKCSDNVLPILPNLIPYLLAQNPSVPTYFGSSLLTDARQPAYFDDHMFGFTLGVLKTLAAANLSDEVKDKAISTGLLFGELMYSLPDQPTLPTRQDQEPHHLAANPTSQSTTLVSHAPASPDPRTGLIYLDAGRLIAPFQSPYGAPGDRALGWYDIADDRAYEFDALEQAIRDVRAKGRRFRWDAPGWMEDVVRACEAVGR